MTENCAYSTYLDNKQLFLKGKKIWLDSKILITYGKQIIILLQLKLMPSGTN